MGEKPTIIKYLLKDKNQKEDREESQFYSIIKVTVEAWLDT